MDWKRQIYIWQNSRRTNLKNKLCWKPLQVPFGNALEQEKGPKITWRATGTANGVWIQGKLCSKCVFCVIQGVPKAGSSAHPTKKWDGKGTNPFLQQPHSRSRTRTGEPGGFPTLWWKICLFLLEMQEREVIHGTHSGSHLELSWNSSGKAKAAQGAGIPHSKVSKTFCLSCTVFIKIGCYLSFST